MQANIEIKLSNEQIEQLLQNEVFCKNFAKVVAENFSYSCLLNDKFITAIKKDFTHTLLEKELDNIKKGLDKKVNLIISKRLGESIQKSIMKNLNKEE